jgi:uncharacterized protein
MSLTLRFYAFVLLFSIILAVGSYYIANRAIKWLGLSKPVQKIMRVATIVLVIAESISFVLQRTNPAKYMKFLWAYWSTYIVIGLFASVLFYTLLVDGLLWFSKKRAFFSAEKQTDLSRRGFLAIGTVSLSSTAIGAVQAFDGPNIYEVTIPLPDLPEAFDGFRIVQITDLHVGPTIKKAYTEHVVKMANQLDADIVALTGDFIDGFVSQLKEDVAPLRHLKSKHGLFYVTGNHEYMWGADEWIEEFRQLGARVLMNEHVILEKSGQKVVLAGVTDFSAEHLFPLHASNPQKSLEGAPLEATKILLAHQPKSYEKAEQAGFDLQLSGHTHGGQFFPFSLLVAAVQRYYKGLNKHKNMWIYVSRGTGYWGPPLRFGVPTEITLIKLSKQPQPDSA